MSVSSLSPIFFQSSPNEQRKLILDETISWLKLIEIHAGSGSVEDRSVMIDLSRRNVSVPDFENGAIQTQFNELVLRVQKAAEDNEMDRTIPTKANTLLHEIYFECNLGYPTPASFQFQNMSSPDQLQAQHPELREMFTPLRSFSIPPDEGRPTPIPD